MKITIPAGSEAVFNEALSGFNKYSDIQFTIVRFIEEEDFTIVEISFPQDGGKRLYDFGFQVGVYFKTKGIKL